MLTSSIDTPTKSVTRQDAAEYLKGALPLSPRGYYVIIVLTSDEELRLALANGVPKKQIILVNEDRSILREFHRTYSDSHGCLFFPDKIEKLAKWKGWYRKDRYWIEAIHLDICGHGMIEAFVWLLPTFSNKTRIVITRCRRGQPSSDQAKNEQVIENFQASVSGADLLLDDTYSYRGATGQDMLVSKFRLVATKGVVMEETMKAGYDALLLKAKQVRDEASAHAKAIYDEAEKRARRYEEVARELNPTMRSERVSTEHGEVERRASGAWTEAIKQVFIDRRSDKVTNAEMHEGLATLTGSSQEGIHSAIRRHLDTGVLIQDWKGGPFSLGQPSPRKSERIAWKPIILSIVERGVHERRAIIDEMRKHCGGLTHQTYSGAIERLVGVELIREGSTYRAADLQ